MPTSIPSTSHGPERLREVNKGRAKGKNERSEKKEGNAAYA